jgi:hypothetical protein
MEFCEEREGNEWMARDSTILMTRHKTPHQKFNINTYLIMDQRDETELTCLNLPILYPIITLRLSKSVRGILQTGNDNLTQFCYFSDCCIASILKPLTIQTAAMLQLSIILLRFCSICQLSAFGKEPLA